MHRSTGPARPSCGQSVRLCTSRGRSSCLLRSLGAHDFLPIARRAEERRWDDVVVLSTQVAAVPGVPAYDQHVMQEKRHKYCIAVFVINEGDRVRRQLAEMASLSDTVDIVVADGGSTDGSLALDSLDAFRLRALLVKRSPGKLSAQMR